MTKLAAFDNEMRVFFWRSRAHTKAINSRKESYAYFYPSLIGGVGCSNLKNNACVVL